jgi:hypothetical protein
LPAAEPAPAARDKASLDIFWLKDESLADSDNLPPPEVIAQEIVDDLEAAVDRYGPNHRFTARDIRALHRTWLGPIYPLAGRG